MRTERTLGILKLFAAFAILIQITSCSQPRPPVVITLEVTDIEGNQAQSGGQIIDDGGAQIISKGICWGPDMFVDTSNFKTTLGPGAEDFIGIMTNLEYNTTYFVAACPTPGIAARLCDELDLNGYQDWYLPSVDELTLMCTNLHKKGLGNFNTDRNYWSSTEYNANLGRDYSFAWDYSSGTIKSGYPEYVRNVRAIRAF